MRIAKSECPAGELSQPLPPTPFEFCVSLCYRPLTQAPIARLEATMRLLRYFVPLLFVFSAMPSLGHAQSSDAIRLSITKNVMDEIAHDRLASARERFSPDLKDSVSENDIKDLWKDLVEVAGSFQEQISQTTRTVQATPMYISQSQCARFKIELRLTFNEANQITDFQIGPISDLSPESMEASAKAITDLLRQEHFDQVTAQFNGRMKEAMPTNRLGASWTHVTAHLGQFKGIKQARKDPDFDRVDVRCEFENGLMILRVAFDPSGKVGGLWMLPAEPEKDSQI
jgi:hypothetical protein